MSAGSSLECHRLVGLQTSLVCYSWKLYILKINRWWSFIRSPTISNQIWVLSKYAIKYSVIPSLNFYCFWQNEFASCSSCDVALARGRGFLHTADRGITPFHIHVWKSLPKKLKSLPPFPWLYFTLICWSCSCIYVLYVWRICANLR